MKKETITNEPALIISESMPQGDRCELWGRLIDVVEDFLEEKGIHIDNPEKSDDPDDEEAIIFGSDYDTLANGFAAVLGINRDAPDVLGINENA